MTLGRLAAVLPALFLLGCPYDSTTPVAEPGDAPLDERLIGSWRCVSSASEEPHVISFSRVDATELRAVVHAGDDDPGPFRLKSAKAGAAQLVNVEALEAANKKPWSLARFTLHRADVLQIELAREEPFDQAPSDSPRTVVPRALERGDLFADWCVCARIREERP